MTDDHASKRALFTRPKSFIGLPLPYCPGCSHGVLQRLIASTIDELGIRSKVVGISCVGCSIRMWRNIDCDMTQAMHGRGPAVATGLKRSMPDRLIWLVQGDGDMAAIGLAEIIHAAARGERISVFFLNNAYFGSTGGQMAPTTLLGQATTSTPQGRDVGSTGSPLHMAELLATLEGPAYIARVSVCGAGRVRQAQRAIRKAFQVQMAGAGFSLVEVLGICPTNLHLTPTDALAWLEDEMIPCYPLGDLKSPDGV
jgi:2-oxoglutarate ferredoxin oxidoreductase subunit beta